MRNQNNKTPLAAVRISRSRHTKTYTLAVPYYAPVNNKININDVCAMDPGVGTFMTTFDTNGFCSEWGEGDMKRIFSLCLCLDQLISTAYGHKKGKRERRKRKPKKKPSRD